MWLTNLKAVLPDQTLESASVRLEDGYIAEIREGKLEGTDCQGLTLIPGIVDLHGDMLEREIEPRPGAEFPVPVAMMELDKRLAAAGVTTAFAAISFSEAKSTKTLRSEERARGIIRAIHEGRGGMRVDWRVHARFEVTNHGAPPVLRDLIAARDVHLVSLTDHTPGQGQYRDLERFVDFMARWREVSREDAQVRVKERIQRTQEAPPSWPVIRDVTALAREHHIPLASHDDDTLEKVDLMADLGTTISEFPVDVIAAREARRRGMWVAMGAPNALRGGSHSGNVGAAELLDLGLLDLLMSDYAAGALLQAAYALHRRRGLPLHRAAALVTANPAQAVGLRDQGSLAAGMRADLVLVEELEYPRVRTTLREGRKIYSDGTLSV
ncbi:MAG: alpha-D-ribose 1-methylphosphonate 5-triphosphate diphosphatase [Meiothermus sp.]|nr:alpha-D-ribose 1-methylphosphonate 5-triphosphate diphosphatase [Meiothermus sp.]